MKIGEIVTGTVTGIQPYGAFVKIDENTSGLIHISEISEGFVRDIHRFVKVGEQITCKVIDADENNTQLRLSLKALENTSRRVRQNIRKPVKPTIGFTTIEEMLPVWIEEVNKEIHD